MAMLDVESAASDAHRHAGVLDAAGCGASRQPHVQRCERCKMEGPQWGLTLRGSDIDLKAAVELFGQGSDPTIEVIGTSDGEPVARLTSARMEALTDPGQVNDVAHGLLSLVNGALFVLDRGRTPLTAVTLCRWADGERKHFIFAQGIAGPSRTRFGEPVNTSPVPWVAAAQIDEVVADVLTYLRGEADWFDLYKAFERMRDNINQRLGGQHRQEEMGWPPKKPDLDHFTLSAQVYRHAPPWDGDYTPEIAMRLSEARRFMQSLTSKWLAWRLS
jgi:hypothetical protein